MTRRARLHDALVDALVPAALEILDESDRHRGRAGTESHFKIVVVSDAFAGTTLVARHRSVHRVVADEFEAGLHALSIFAYTPAEWTARGEAIPSSPPCRGGGD
jgi:BolA family transcriptional regulator, general stress-responsive regulator